MSADRAPLPANAVEAYETLRSQVLAGQARPDGLGAIVFHGMWCGLRVLLSTAPASPSPLSPLSPTSSPSTDVHPPGMVHDRRFVQLLANMLLFTQSKEEYAY